MRGSGCSPACWPESEQWFNRSCASWKSERVRADEIPIAHTPPGGFGATFPPKVLVGCDEPLAPGAPDLRGLWKAVSATRGGSPVSPDDHLLTYVERIEQCGNRIGDGDGTPPNTFRRLGV